MLKVLVIKYKEKRSILLLSMVLDLTFDINSGTLYIEIQNGFNVFIVYWDGTLAIRAQRASEDSMYTVFILFEGLLWIVP